MTGLFDRKLGKVEAAVSVLPNLPQESAVIPAVASAPKNLNESTDFLDDAEISFAGEKSPTDAILEIC